MIELELLSKYLHRVRRREEDAEAILYPLMHVSPDEPYGVTRFLPQPGRSCVDRDALLYVGL